MNHRESRDADVRSNEQRLHEDQHSELKAVLGVFHFDIRSTVLGTLLSKHDAFIVCRNYGKKNYNITKSISHKFV